jgi:FAD/FMN-containing dehydrogenase
MTTTTQRFQLEPAAVEGLQRNFHGELIERSHPAYGEHRRLWNGSIDRYPTVITRCADTADVCAAVRFARRLGMPLAVRSGGHSFPGLSVCDDGIVVDLHMMCEIHVDPEHSTARAQDGVLLGKLDAATQKYGLAVPSGIVTHTGVAGLTLGGGIGWLMRKYGLTIDQLMSVDLVTADGQVVTASETQNADLFGAPRWWWQLVQGSGP